MAPFTETIPTLAQIPSPPLQDLTARLPAEVVLEVFLFVAAFKPSEHKQTPPSTRVSHVCRRWREIALQHQILWTTLSMPHFDGISMNLERSGTLPLTVHLIHVFPSKIPRRTYDHLALEALPRVRSLAFSLWPRYDYSTLWTRPAPRLESLTLTALRRRVGLSLVDFKRLTDDIFDAHVPRLRTLRLHACEIHPTSPLFSAQLRKLELKNIRCLFPTAPNLHDPEALLDALRTMPNLEELAIISPVSEKGWLERVVDEGPVVPLDRLCKLVLEDYASRLSSFIRRLRRPATCSVALRMINMHDEDLTAVSQSVDEALAPLRAAKFVYNKVHVSWEGVDPGYWYTNGGIEVVRIVVSEPEDPSLPAHLEMTIDVEEMDISPTLVALTHIFPPS
ncbi:hypothetical protein OF83DRAFT_853769 [Amylostereum chailletii]|nr:hypothetical protein OF83DRAFT_853769 [Amylostereum chailletii]